MNNYEDILLEDLELSVRARNCYANHNIKTIGDLLDVGQRRLLSMYNFGRMSLKETKLILEQLQLELPLRGRVSHNEDLYERGIRPRPRIICVNYRETWAPGEWAQQPNHYERAQKYWKEQHNG